MYYFSKNGKELRQACAIVHKFSMDVIKKRRKELEEVTTIHIRREQMHIYLINCNHFKFELMNVFKILKKIEFQSQIQYVCIHACMC